MQSNRPFCLTSGLRSLLRVGCRPFEMSLRPLETNHALSLFLVGLRDSFCSGVVSTPSPIHCSIFMNIKNLRLQLPCQPPSSPCSPFHQSPNPNSSTRPSPPAPSPSCNSSNPSRAIYTPGCCYLADSKTRGWEFKESHKLRRRLRWDSVLKFKEN